MMMSGEEKIVAEHLYQAFSNAPKPGSRKKPEAAAANLSGQWDVHLEFVSGSADHNFTIEQNGNDLAGTHLGQAAMRELKGSLDGSNVVIRSSYTQHGARLNFTFTGTADGDRMQGPLLVGEYGSGHWTAKRHEHQFPRGGQPIPG
jgi:L-seryl-tRNA(Ser) seleniumtransferase